jgi:cation:H+ antiporter
MYYCFRSDVPVIEEGNEHIRGLGVSLLLIVAGLGGLIGGGQLFVNNATAIARALGVSDKFIALTMLAGGTSLPELATCIVAAVRKKDQLALGNVLGSNVFNILLVLGASGVVTPLSTFALTWVDLVVLLLSAALLWLWTYTGKRDRVDRGEAALMLLLFFGYYTWLFIKL